MANNMRLIVRDIEVSIYEYEEDIEDFVVRQEQSEHNIIFRLKCTHFYF